ncbi:tape measure protein [Faecalibacterium sp.]|uniref:tape measure protein n=1 Tax=Faecalibacterium sp. TaxID=1971605 RepID=UPI00352918E5
MSQEVDERVVEMRFDNAQFEKNVHQTMQSLEQLNDSLRLDGAEKGFEKISDASAKVDFDEMQGALDNLSGKFSAVEVMGVAALSHITRQAVDTGERLVKSLSLDQVTSGWNKYAQKTASVQTIMNATGKSIAKVNGYLEKLMWFSDETSYGFTDMTSALSTLTSTGGSIEKMIPMIMGMANATAYAGKGAAEFQRVIYNLAQSYGTGAIQLIDWKSVEQAGVASQQLKQLLIDTGVELGKIKKGAVTTGSFDNSLQKKWADREVMEKAFGKYAEFAEAVKAELDANPNKYHGQASLAIEAIADQYDEVTVKAFKAAQEAKSFSEAVDATKDAVSSGWMETFDILFGNYDEAKGFWSDLAEEFWNMFAGGAAGRNNWLKNAFDSGLDQLLGTEGFGEAGDNYTNLLQKALVNQGLLSEEGIEEAGSFQKALEESGVTAQQLYEVLGEAADYYYQRAAMSDEELDKLGFDRGKVDALANAYDSMAEKIQNGSVNLDDLAGKMNQLSGREHFFNGILNVLEGINSVLSPIRDGFGDVFMTDGSPLYNFLKGFDELTGKMALSEETAEKVQKVFTGVFRVLSIGLKGVTTVGKTAFMILGKLLDLLSPMGDLLLNIGSCIGNLLTWVDESLGQAESLSDVLGILVGAVAALVSPIADVVKGVKTLVRGGNMEEAKKQFGAFGTVVDAVGSVLDKFKIDSVSAGNVIGTAFQLLGGILLGAFEGVGALIARVFNGFKGAGDTVSEFADSKVPLLKNIRDVVLSLPEKAEKALADFGGTLTGIMSSISGACRNALGAVKDFFNLQDGVDIYRLLALIDVGALAAAIYGATVLLKKASDNFKKTLANPIGDFFNSLTGAVNTWTKANTTNNLATAAKAIATAVALISGSMYLLAKIDDPMRAVQALASVISELFSMVVALKVLAATDLTGLDTAKLIGTVVAISIGMAALTNTVAKLGKMDAAQAEKSVEAVGHIAAMLAGMTGLLALFNKQLGGVKGAGGFVAAAAAVDMIALALIPLAKAEANGLDIDGAVEAINGVAIAMSILTVAAGFAQKLAGKADMSTLDKIIKYLVKLGGMLVAINAMGTALLMAAGAVAIFASLGDRMMDGIRGAGLVVSGIAALLVLMANTKVNPLRMKMGAESMVIASASLLVMAAAVKQMGKAMGTDAGGAGMAGVSLMLIGLAGALYLLGKQAPESTAAAVAMVAMGAAMIEMALAIKMLADVDFVDIVKSVFSLAAALGVLIAGCWGLGFVSANLASAAGACLMLATALLILTPAFKGLASLTAGEAFAGVIGTIGIMLGLFAVGAITPVAAGMVVFSACLISLGKAFSAFAGGIIKLSIAAAILTVLSAFAGPLREVIVNAADDIEAALTAILTAICNTINNCAEPIGAALLTLCKVLIQTVIDLIGWAWSGEGGEGNGIEGALEELWSQFVEWLGEKKDEAGELIGKQLNPANWFTVKGGLLGSLLDSADTAADEREMTEYGTYMAEGLANGLTGPESTNVVTGGIATLCSTVETFFRNFWGIHSPSTRMADLSEYIPEGFKEGLTGTDGTAAIGDGISGMLDSAGSWLDKLFPGLLNKAKNYGSQFQNALLSGSEYQGMPGFDEWYEKEISAYRVKRPGGKTGLTAEDLDADIKKDPDDNGNKKPTTTGKKKGSSGTKKTVAQQIEEKYKPKLEANKAAREALDSEYELWQTENQYSADEDTLLAKKMENAAAEIANQTDRVAIAQAKYDEMLKRWGADKTETKEAYTSLLSEKTSLAKLQADQYTGLFEDITKRYDTDLGTLEKEYNLWTAQNSNTTSKLDKIDRETEYQKDELELKQKKEAKAKEQWETLRKEYGESDLRTKEAWNDYLDVQTESLQLQNDIAKQSLNKLDAQLSIIKDEQSRMQSRMDLLTSIYGDGSLADRAEAYKQAVEEYGENSAEARKAKYQGITTSILGTVEALQNMNAELEKTRLIQQQLADGKDLNGNPLSKDDVNDLKDQLLSSRSSMVSFAGALADAMGLEDSAKSAVVKLANAIQKNWVPISNACSEVWTKVSGAMGEEMTNTLSTVFKAAFSEEGMEIGTEFVSAIASAMQGDYAGAIISAATGLIDLLFTDTGKQLTGGAGDMLLKLFSGIQNGDLAGKLANIGTAAANVGNSLSGLLPMLGQLGTTGAGAGMAVGGIGEALGGLGASILAVLPELLIVVGIIAAIAALIGGIAWFISSRKKEKATGAKDVGSEIDKGISDGVKEDAPIVDDAVSDMTENAMDIAKGSLGTISKVMGDDYEYTPQIVPVVDLTNVLEGADEIDNAFAGTKSLSLDGDVSRNLANKIDAEVQLQNGLKSAGNEDTLRAINALAGHMDGVAESIKGMSVTINGRKAIGYIDDRMGRLTAAKVK